MLIVRGEDSNSRLKLLPTGNLTVEVLALEGSISLFGVSGGVSVVGWGVDG